MSYYSEIAALSKEHMLIAIGPNGQYLKNLKNDLGLKHIWWNQSKKSIQIWGPEFKMFTAKKEIMKYLDDIKTNNKIKTYEEKYIKYNYMDENDVLIKTKTDNYIRTMIYTIMGQKDKCFEFYNKIESEYPTNPYFTKIQEIEEIINDKVEMTIYRSTTSD